MKIVSSYGIEIKQVNKIFRPTVAIYNDAISFCVDVFENEWKDIEKLDTMQRKQYAEILIHTTKNNKAKYDFDSKFYKMPSYMRRSVINSALGYLSSYHSNLDNWFNQSIHPKIFIPVKNFRQTIKVCRIFYYNKYFG